MTFYIQYADEYSRIIAAIVVESRQVIPETKNKSGFEVFDFFNEVISAVDGTVVPYKIEADNGSLVAYFSVKVTNGLGVLFQKYVRPNFATFQNEITQKINTFIFNNEWKPDFLFGELK